jgi:hypothetical protein
LASHFITKAGRAVQDADDLDAAVAGEVRSDDQPAQASAEVIPSGADFRVVAEHFDRRVNPVEHPVSGSRTVSADVCTDLQNIFLRLGLAPTGASFLAWLGHLSVTPTKSLSLDPKAQVFRFTTDRRFTCLFWHNYPFANDSVCSEVALSHS